MWSLLQPGGSPRYWHSRRPNRYWASGAIIERQLTSGARQTFVFELHAGDFVHAIVEQKGVDIVAELKGPDDSTGLRKTVRTAVSDLSALPSSRRRAAGIGS